MAETVRFSTIETNHALMTAIEGYFTNNRFAQITQAIGIHSILVDPQHAISNQARSYGAVLTMIKTRIAGNLGKRFGAWYADFPKLMDGLIAAGQNTMDESARSVLASRKSGQGSFKSLDDFFSWALDDRKLNLEYIVKLIERTAEKY